MEYQRRYTPEDWFWFVGGDETKAWSSAASAYVNDWGGRPVTKIASEAQLTEVLAALGLPGPLVTADQVRAEASRRMQLLVGARDADHLGIIISNGSREAIKLLRIRQDRPWTPEEAARAAQLEGVEFMIEKIRDSSNALEPNPPKDYKDNKYWP